MLPILLPVSFLECDSIVVGWRCVQGKPYFDLCVYATYILMNLLTLYTIKSHRNVKKPI